TRTSSEPWPQSATHRNRPSGVSALPVGKLPTVVRRPTGCSARPFAVIPSDGPISPLWRLSASATPPAASTRRLTAPAIHRPLRSLETGQRIRDPRSGAGDALGDDPLQ